jgi:hypothetical protein
MALRSVPAPQLALDEKVVEIASLEEALEERHSARLAAGEARKAYKEAHEAAKVEIEKLELPEDTPVRAGRFRITRSAVAARSVAFDYRSHHSAEHHLPGRRVAP